ncbi:MAG: type secretion system protein [Myxococcaceae bacterium]|nr:type secretion system protein [Myxococcaceae bacterium]
MFTVVIAEKEGAERRVTFTEAEVTVGRVPGNDVVLPKGNVSKRHSRIVLKDNRFIVVDLKSTNGTFVNGRKITSPLVVKEGDKIYVGDYVLTLEGAPALDALKPPSLLGMGTLGDGQMRAPGVTISDGSEQSEELDDDDLPAVLRGGGTLSQSSIPGRAARTVNDEAEDMHGELAAHVEDEHLLPAESDLEAFEDRSSGEQARGPGSDVHAAKVFPPPFEGRARAPLVVLPEPLAHESLLGPLEGVLADPQVFHIVVERFDRIRADRGTGLTLENGVSFASPHALVAMAEEVQTLAGIPLGTASFDVSLPNGLQVVGLMLAAATNGTLLSVRRRPTHVDTLVDLAQLQVVSAEIANKLEEALLHKRHVWLIGPSGLDVSGFFGSVLAACPENERLALFERAPEVAVGERSTLCIKLGTVPAAELFERVRSFRPDRLAVYGLREDELAPVLESFSHRADGNITSFEARSAKDALAAFARAVGADVTMRAASLLVELRRGGDGRTRVNAAYDIELDGSGDLALKQT